MLRLLVVTLILTAVVVFPSSLEYYQSAMNAYINERYAEALQWFEKAVQLDPKIESFDSLVKLRMGICAFAIKDYQKAKAYLLPYRDQNPVAAKILQLIDQQQDTTEEWLKWIRSRTQPVISSESATSQKRKGVHPFFLIGIFIATFSGTLVIMLLLKKLKARKSSEIREVTLEEQLEKQMVEVRHLVEDVQNTSKTSQSFTKQDLEDLEKLESELNKLVEEVLKEGFSKTEEKVVLPNDEDPYEVLKKLEEKATYNEEDAELLSKTLEKIISSQEEKEQNPES